MMDLHEDERMMEDDIDRLIAQMQNKPYDSSKYMESEEPRKENYNHTNHYSQGKFEEERQRRDKPIGRIPPIIRQNST